MTASLRFEILGEPVPQARARFTRAGRMYTPAKTRKWKEHVSRTAIAAAAEAGFAQPLTGPLRLSVSFSLPIPPSWTKRKQNQALLNQVLPIGKPDVDNLAKAVMDAINDCIDAEKRPLIWKDDCQVVTLIAAKRYGATSFVTVAIEEIQP
jgi:Holliday junction resolvase RusA-like endonuclease